MSSFAPPLFEVRPTEVDHALIVCGGIVALDGVYRPRGSLTFHGILNDPRDQALALDGA
jgi:hypothetical protein